MSGLCDCDCCDHDSDELEDAPSFVGKFFLTIDQHYVSYKYGLFYRIVTFLFEQQLPLQTL